MCMISLPERLHCRSQLEHMCFVPLAELFLHHLLHLCCKLLNISAATVGDDCTLRLLLVGVVLVASQYVVVDIGICSCRTRGDE